MMLNVGEHYNSHCDVIPGLDIFQWERVSIWFRLHKLPSDFPRPTPVKCYPNDGEILQ